ncbi:hypothetical protein ACS0TY_008555 [Phlomoides rotata]
MALSSCFFTSRLCFSLGIDSPRFSCNKIKCVTVPKNNNSEMFGKQVMGKECVGWSFVRGSSNTSRPNLGRNILCRKSSVVYASWLPCSEIASGAFTLGTVAVLPFYTSMVVAPRADFTKKLVTSSLPYMVLGALYAYLLYLSWTPDTMRFMFASKYWLPELPGIAKMFSSEITLASAWIHLLAVDLFAARSLSLSSLSVVVVVFL